MAVWSPEKEHITKFISFLNMKLYTCLLLDVSLGFNSWTISLTLIDIKKKLFLCVMIFGGNISKHFFLLVSLSTVFCHSNRNPNEDIRWARLFQGGS